jgi:hypothetical protein
MPLSPLKCRAKQAPPSSPVGDSSRSLEVAFQREGRGAVASNNTMGGARMAKKPVKKDKPQQPKKRKKPKKGK